MNDGRKQTHKHTLQTYNPTKTKRLVYVSSTNHKIIHTTTPLAHLSIQVALENSYSRPSPPTRRRVSSRHPGTGKNKRPPPRYDERQKYVGKEWCSAWMGPRALSAMVTCCHIQHCLVSSLTTRTTNPGLANCGHPCPPRAGQDFRRTKHTIRSVVSAKQTTNRAAACLLRWNSTPPKVFRRACKMSRVGFVLSNLLAPCPMPFQLSHERPLLYNVNRHFLLEAQDTI